MRIGQAGPVRRRIAAALALCAVAVVVGACGGSDDDDGAAGARRRQQAAGADTGATITMWTRAATQAQSERLVKAYNATHKNQVKLTVIPTDNYQARVAAAAGGKNLPDVFASDVIYAPNYTSQGLYLDITDRIDALPFKDSLAPAHMRLGTYEDASTRVPHTLDLSVLFWNKDLYEKAGLDPEKPPKTLKEFAEQARTIREKVGGKTYGTFFGGNCPGCYVFTFWPSVWAGGRRRHERGRDREHDRRPEHGRDVRDLPRPGRRRRGRAGRQGRGRPDLDRRASRKGKIGVMPMPSTTLGLMPQGHGHRRRADPRPRRRRVDVRRRRRDRHLLDHRERRRGLGLRVLDAVGDEAQVEIMAKNKDVAGPHRPRRQQVLGRRPARRASSTASWPRARRRTR